VFGRDHIPWESDNRRWSGRDFLSECFDRNLEKAGSVLTCSPRSAHN